MTPDELIALPVKQATANTAYLYLWVPNALLPTGLRVMEAWGSSIRQTSYGTKSARMEARTVVVSTSTSAIQQSLCDSAYEVRMHVRSPPVASGEHDQGNEAEALAEA
jgi:N6-adenosine-specific RNA methylase IME4